MVVVTYGQRPDTWGDFFEALFGIAVRAPTRYALAGEAVEKWTDRVDH